ALCRRAEEAHPLELSEPPERVDHQLVLVLLDRREADLAKGVERCAEADRRGDRGRAGLELVRKVVERGALEAHRADHLAAEIERLHGLQELASAPERPDPTRAAELVGREGEEVAAAA